MNNKTLKITLLLLALIQMGPLVMAPIIGELVNAFPQYSPSVIQSIMTLPNLIIVFTSILTGKLDSIISRKTLAIIACVSILTGSIGLYLFHTTLVVMYIFSAFIGIGVGIITPLCATLTSAYFDEKNQSILFGLQNSFCSLGGVFLTLVGGFLAGIAWHYDFLALLIIIPGFIMACFTVSNEKGKQHQQQKVTIPTLVWKYCLFALLFLIIFNTLPTNLALFITERNLGNNSFMGIVNAIVLVGGFSAGMLFPKLTSKFKEKTIAIGYFNLGLGLLIMTQAYNPIVLVIGAFIGGCSISLLMAQLTLSVSSKVNPIVAPMGLSLIMAANNLGNFLSPILFGLLPQQFIGEKYLLFGILGIVLSIFIYFHLNSKEV